MLWVVTAAAQGDSQPHVCPEKPCSIAYPRCLRHPDHVGLVKRPRLREDSPRRTVGDWESLHMTTINASVAYHDRVRFRSGLSTFIIVEPGEIGGRCQGKVRRRRRALRGGGAGGSNLRRDHTSDTFRFDVELAT